MSNIHVANTAGAGLRFERAFVSAHPALRLRLSAGSGSVHGDGDGRPTHVDHGAVQFALEGKVRHAPPLSGRAQRRTRPTPAEWVKAMGDPTRRPGSDDWRGQLRKYAPRAVRLFAVYNCAPDTYEVWVPEEDAAALEPHTGPLPGQRVAVRPRRGPARPAVRMEYGAWADAYHAVEAALGAP